jgi:hypothetical protein
MKRILILMMIFGLVLGSIATADAKKKKKPAAAAKVERVVDGAYDAPSLLVVGTCAQTGAVGCVSIVTGAEEAFAQAEVTDQTGQPVFVSAQADTDGDSNDDLIIGSFCGKTETPLQFPGGTEVHFWIGVTPDPAIAGCAPGAGTTGTIKVTLSNLP